MPSTIDTLPKFVILLERDAKRVRNVQENILATLPECQIIPAVDGKTLTTSVARSEVSKEVWTRLGPFKLACLLSHLTALKLVVNKKLSHALIFEDDVKVPACFGKQLKLVLSELPDDCEHLYLYTHPKYRHQDDTPFLLPEKRHVRKYSYTYCNLAYLVSFDGAKKLVHHLSQPYDYTDFMVNDLIGNDGLKSYMTRVSLVENLGQLTDTTDNQPLPSNIVKPRSFWNKVRSELHL